MTGRRDELGHGHVPPDAVADMRSVIDHAHEAVVAMNAAGLVTDWNPQAERTFGWSREEAVGRVLAELIIPPRYRGAHLAGLRRFRDSGRARCWTGVSSSPQSTDQTASFRSS